MRTAVAWALLLLPLFPLLAEDGHQARLAAMRRAAADLPAVEPRPRAQQAALPAQPPVISGVALVHPVESTTVPRYGRLELRLDLAEVDGVSPYETEPARGGIDIVAVFTAPDAREWTAYGFFDGVDYRVRFAPAETGFWSYRLRVAHAGGEALWFGGSFTCVASDDPGWLRIDGDRLVHADGSPFWGLGYNTGWMYEVRVPDLATMRAAGVDLLSFWLAVPWAQPSFGGSYWQARSALENRVDGVGNYNQAACRYIDEVVFDAMEAGVYLLPSLWSHGQLRTPSHPWSCGTGDCSWWDDNGYSVLLGDDSTGATEFFRRVDAGMETEQWSLQKNFLRYCIARWGWSTAIAGWVSLVEAEGTDGWRSDRALVERWTEAVADHCAALDPFRRNAAGAYPMVATRSDSGAPDWDTSDDLRAADSYRAAGNDNAIAARLAGELARMRSGGEPAFHAEFGGRIDGGASQPRHLHNGLWASLGSGAACAPLLWCDGGSFPLPAAPPIDPRHGAPPTVEPDLLDRYAIAAAFRAGGGPGDAGYTAATINLDRSTAAAYGRTTGQQSYAWIARAGPVAEPGGVRLLHEGLAAGLYTVEWFDLWQSGDLAIDRRVDAWHDGSGLDLALPATAREDLGLRLRRYAAVNQAPVCTIAAGVVRATAGATLVLPDWATGISAGSAAEDAVQTLRFVVEATPATVFASPPRLDADGTLHLELAADAVGPVTLAVTLVDDGGQAGGGSDRGSTQLREVVLGDRLISLALDRQGVPLQDLGVTIDGEQQAVTDATGRVTFAVDGSLDHLLEPGLPPTAAD